MSAKRVPYDTRRAKELLHTLADSHHTAPLWEPAAAERLSDWKRRRERGKTPAFLRILRGLMASSGAFLCLQALCSFPSPLCLPWFYLWNVTCKQSVPCSMLISPLGSREHICCLADFLFAPWLQTPYTRSTRSLAPVFNQWHHRWPRSSHCT